jgi:predicted secreted protein
MVKHIKAGYAKDGELTDKEKSTAYATAWKQHNKDKNESIEGDNMTNLKEGEVQQASAIVSAKTMVDRVGRWIEDLSGMENDTLLTLGDSIRDEMSQELAKQFISQAAPALQQAIETLKQTRDTLASSVRVLTGEEQGAEMIGAEPTDAGADMEAPAEPDALNAAPEGDVGAVAPEDEFAAAEPAAGGLGDAGRAKRESIERSNSLLRVLAG